MPTKQEDLIIKFKCQRCGNCCSLYCIPCTDKDIKRIMQFLKLPPEDASDFVELVEPEGDVLESYADVPKILVEDYRDSENLVLVMKSGDKDEYCTFFDEEEKRCRIHPVRPMVCRFFPIVYEYEDGSELDLIDKPNEIKFSIFDESDYCKGLGKGKKVNVNNLRKNTVKTIKEDSEFEKKVKIWNLRVIFNKVKDWDEIHFLKYILDIRD